MSVSTCEDINEYVVAVHLIFFYFLAEHEQALPEYLGATGLHDARRFMKYLGVLSISSSGISSTQREFIR